MDVIIVLSLFFPGRQAWDLAVDICLSQLPDVIENPGSFKVFGVHPSVCPSVSQSLSLSVTVVSQSVLCSNSHLL